MSFSTGMMGTSDIFGANTGVSISERRKASEQGEIISDEGRNGDSMMIHASPFTMQLLKDLGGSGSFNPSTGMLEFYNVDDMMKKKMGL